jgi:ribosomal protein S18 acetylase RimI-like enzyme
MPDMSADLGHRTIDYRRLAEGELDLVRDIDRAERIDALYTQHGTRHESRSGDFKASPWRLDGAGAHSVAAQVAALREYVESGAVAFGALDSDRLVGIALVKPHVRPGIAQLVYLHVSNGYRAEGIGGRLCDELEVIAREAGDTSMVVSATPSLNTVRFYERRGFRPMAEPLPELLELEPEDVHMVKSL